MYSEMEYTDPGEPGVWYDNDLQLAAELGKTLLERNKELESQLKVSQHTQIEQAKEIDLLTKQLDVLRNVNDSRMRIYEEVDRNLQELEKTNTKFRLEIRGDKDKVKRLTETVENLEIKCAELNTKLEELQSTERQRKRQDRQRNWSSVPSLVESSQGTSGKFDYLGFPSVFKPGDKKATDPLENEHIRKLNETLKGVRVELAREQRKREEAESKSVKLMQANGELTAKLTRIEQDQEEIALSEQESFAPDVKALQVMCRSCRSETSSIADAELLEHDIEEVPRGQVVRLKCGGSAYGSRESLHLIGLEADDFTVESGSDILVSGNVINWQMDDDPNKASDENVSLLGELEAQYRKLVTKYELLIEAKGKRAAAKEVATQDNLDEQPEATTSGVTLRNNGRNNRDSRSSWRKSLNLAMDLCSPLDPIDGHFENGPPEYKRLFKEIFETLQRSVDFEDEMNDPWSSKTSNSSPEEPAKTIGDKSG